MRKLFALSAILLLSACAESPRKSRPGTPDPTTEEQRADLRGTQNYQFLNAVFKNSDTTLAFRQDTILIQEARQVGKDGDTQFPYPTQCKLEIKSKYHIYKLVQSETDFLEDNNYRKADFKIESHNIEYKLLDDDNNSDKCETYVIVKNEQILLGKKLTENRYFQKVSNTQIDNVISNKSFSTSLN